MRVVCISDTHGYHRDVHVPEGDLLVHAGDLTGRGELSVLRDFNDWLGELPHPDKVVIAGNHDFCFANRRNAAARACLSNCDYLQDSWLYVNGLKIYGTPWQPWFHDWAFNVRSEDDRRQLWAQIPEDVDVLLVHGPPRGFGDETKFDRRRVGCLALTERIEKIQPRLVVTGHIHEDYGSFALGATQIINASCLTVDYEPVNPPVVVEL